MSKPPQHHPGCGTINNMRHHLTTLVRLLLAWGLLVLVLAACKGTVASPDSSPSASVPTSGAEIPTHIPAADLFQRGVERRAVGDDSAAADNFRTIVDLYPDAPEVRNARYYLAESYARQGHWGSAVETFRAVAEEPVQDSLTAPAIFWLARSYEEIGDWGSAATTYQQYRTLHTPLEPYAAIRQAAQEQALGQLEQAAQNYEYAATMDIDRAQRAASYERAIAIYQTEQPDHALRLYEDLLGMAKLPSYRSRILSEAATLAETLGQVDTARTWQHEIIAITISSGVSSPYAINAMDHLITVGHPGLSSADAARVYTLAERYEDALRYFDVAIQQAQAAGNTGDDLLELQRQRALVLRSMGNTTDALTALAAVGAASPDSEPGRQAQLDWIQTLGWSGAVQDAADAYQTYAATYPDDWRAPEALDRAAQLLDRLGFAERVLEVRLALGQRYPQSQLAPDALYHAGKCLFDSGRVDEALSVWQQLASTQQVFSQARGAYWGGRAAQAQQNDALAATLFAQAYAAAPDSYYGARSAEELNQTPSPPVTAGTPITEEEWRDLEAWVAGWSGQPVIHVAEQGYPPSVMESGIIQRAIGLGEVGLHTEAIAEWNNARDTWADNPTTIMLVARIAHEHGVPYIALKAAEQLAVLAPSGAPPPLALRRLIFPTPFVGLVVAQARAYGIDPRLLYALMRQESLFNPDATSWAGARGLGQVMPSTGEWIAQQLGTPDFHHDDLYRPYISVQFSAYYIAQQISAMEGSIAGGLAAYNGGLGNAMRWADGTSVADTDQFVERIDYSETRDYVERVSGYYGSYQRLYALP